MASVLPRLNRTKMASRSFQSTRLVPLREPICKCYEKCLPSSMSYHQTAASSEWTKLNPSERSGRTFCLVNFKWRQWTWHGECRRSSSARECQSSQQYLPHKKEETRVSLLDNIQDVPSLSFGDTDNVMGQQHFLDKRGVLQSMKSSWN